MDDIPLETKRGGCARVRQSAMSLVGQDERLVEKGGGLGTAGQRPKKSLSATDRNIYGSIKGGDLTILRHHYLALFGLAFINRLVFAQFSQFSGGDWHIYSNVAQNIYDGCGVAITFEGHHCIPHFGGNQLPGFPAFAALCWRLFDHSDTAIRVAQAALASLAVLRMTYAVDLFTASRTSTLVAGVALAMSPLEAVWTGWLVTETLAIATTTWVMAELLISYANKQLRTVAVATALIAAVWIRMDAVLLLLPSLAVATRILPARQLYRWGLVPVLVGATCLAWSVRNIAVGLPPLPRPSVLLSGTYYGRGYFVWVESWVTGERVRGDMLFRDQRARTYYFPDEAFDDVAEKNAVMKLHRRVLQFREPYFPEDANRGFLLIAQHKRASRSVADNMLLFAKRFCGMSCHTVMLLPFDIGDGRSKISPSDVMRVGIFWMTVLGAFIAARMRDARLALLTAIALGYCLLRAVFFTTTANIELRYMVESMTMLTVAASWTTTIIVTAVMRRHASR